MFPRHRIFQVMAALLVLLGLAFGPASATPAAAATVYYYYITPAHSGHALDVQGASTADGARIIQWYQNWNSSGSIAQNQQWAFEAVPNTYDTYYIQSRSSGKVLTVNSYAAGAPVVQWAKHGGTTQQWHEEQVGAARKYRNVWSGLYLDVSGYSYAAGAPLVQWYQTSGLNQQFYLYH